MRFFFYYPTWRKPSGGFKQIRLMASLLSELGVETYLLRDKGYFAPGGDFDDDVFYHTPIPTAPFHFDEGGAHLGPDDVLLLAEVRLENALSVCRSWNCRLALNNQNGYLALLDRPPRGVMHKAFEFVIANAPYNASLCKYFLGIPEERIFLVPHWVVRPPFDLGETPGPRAPAVCFMPRKLPEAIRQVRDLVRNSHPDVAWVEIDGVPEDQVAEMFRANAVFFATQNMEGCPLPPLEAMSCGCLVAGYAGTAGFPHPYATAENGVWARDRDIPAAAAAVCTAIEAFKTGGPRYHQYLDSGRRTAARFAKPAVRQALADLIAVVDVRGYSRRAHTVDALTWRERLVALRLLYDGDRLGWPGRFVSRVYQRTKAFGRAFSLVRR